MAHDVDQTNPFWEPSQSEGNPFENETSGVDESIDSMIVSSGCQTPVPVEPAIRPVESIELTEEKGLSWEQIAAHLLKKNFHLTALELHTELHEKGIQLPRLRDFFSNPGNFESVREITTSESDLFGERLIRASSSQTLDSIDFAREPSEDDPNARVDERVAVLEFELRKARDVIQSLREHLTNLTGSPEPHVTPNTHANPKTAVAASPVSPSESSAPIQPLEKRAVNFLINEYLLNNDYRLTSITFTDECQNLDFDDWDDVGLNISKPPGLISMYRRFRYGVKVVPSCADAGKLSSTYEAECQTEPGPLPVPDHENLPLTEESPDLILKELRDENSRYAHELRITKQRSEILEREIQSFRAPSRDENAPLDHDEACQASGDRDVNKPPVHHNYSLPPRLSSFFAEIRRTVFPPITETDPENKLILQAISRVALDRPHMISLLADSLLRIIPNVLLAKRQEIIPLLLVAVLLHEDYNVRDKLLHQLFNLLKKPEDQQRQMILRGCERFASLASAERLEGELLPQCWTQISHKYAERRMLVAESCAVLAPYVSSALCGSLIISMLKQMMTEDKNAEVREKVVQSLAVVCLHIDEKDKFGQLSELLHVCLTDNSEAVVRTATDVYLSSFALWTQTYLHLGPQLIEPNFLNKLDTEDEADLCKRISGLRRLVPHIYADVVNHGPWRELEHTFTVDEELIKTVEKRLLTLERSLESLDILIGENYVAQCAMFQSYIDREWFQEWQEFKWVTDVLIPSLCRCASSVHVSKQESVIVIVDLFKHIISYFGDNFATGLISRCMKGKIQELGPRFLYHTVFVCFACAVVALCEPKQLQEFLSSALVSISDQSLPLEGIYLIFKDLSDRFPEDLIQVCWIGIVHHSVPVRLNAARLLRSLTELFRKSHHHLESLIAPLITLASDQEPRIRLEIIPSMSNILKEHIQVEKLLTVFQGFLDDRDHLDIVDESVRFLSKTASHMNKQFHQEFLLPRLAVLVAQNPRLHVYRKDMAVCLLDAYVSLSCSNFGEEPWLVAPVLQSLRSLLQELRELGMMEYVDIGEELSDKLNRLHPPGSLSLSNPDEIKAKVINKIKDSGLTVMFKKK